MMTCTVLYQGSSTSRQGGAERRLLQLASLIRDAGRYRPLVVLHEDSGIAREYRTKNLVVRVVRFLRLRRQAGVLYQIRFLLGLIPAALRLARLIRREGVALVHANDITDLHALVASRLAGVPAIGHLRYIIGRPGIFGLLLVRFFCIFSHHIICISEAVRNSMVPHANKVAVLLDPAPELIRHEPGNQTVRLAVRDRHGIPAGAFVVGTIAKFVTDKGHRNLVELARRARDQGLMDWVFLLVGAEVEGHESYYENLRRQVLELGLDQSMVFAGYCEDIAGMLEAMDVLTHLPNCEESLGSVVMEAMAMEKPVVAFQSGGIPELIVHGETGFLVPKGDLAAAGARLAELDRDPLQRQHMGKRGRQLLMEQFSQDTYRERIEDLYDTILKSTQA